MSESINMLLTNLPDDIIYTIYDNASLIEKVKMMYISKRIYVLIGEMVYEDIKIFIKRIDGLFKMCDAVCEYIDDNNIDIDVNHIVKIIINDDENAIYDLIKMYDADNNINIYKEEYVKYFAYFGNKKMLMSFQAKYNIKYNTNICAYIATTGNLDLLKWAHENGYSWDAHTYGCAAINGHLECLKYACENGCPWDECICAYAAQNGQLECLKYAHENGFPWDKWTCAYAAEKGQLECLKYAYENDCPRDIWTCIYAAKNGQLECLKYAHDNGFPWNEWTCTYAAQNGQLECLKYAYENDCPWNGFVCKNTVKNNHLECLKYAHENNRQWDGYNCLCAAQNDHLECLKYAHKNNCPYNKDILLANKEGLKNHIIEYIEKYM